MSSHEEPAPAQARSYSYQRLLKMLKSMQEADSGSKSAAPATRPLPRPGPKRVSTSPAVEPEGLKLKMKKREESGLWQCAAANKARAQDSDLNQLLKGIVQNIQQSSSKDAPAPAEAPETVSYEKYARQKQKYAELLEDYKKLQLKYDCLEHESQWLVDKLGRGEFAERPAAPAPAHVTAPSPAKEAIADKTDKKHLGRGVYVTSSQWRTLSRAATPKRFVQVAADTLLGRQALLAARGECRPLDQQRLRVIQDVLSELISSGKFSHAPPKSAVSDVPRYIRQYMTSLRLNRHLDAPPKRTRKKKSQDKMACSVCGRGFPTINSLRVHERIHSGQRPYKCSECPLSFAQQSQFNQHTRCYHPLTGVRKCPLCERQYPQLAHVRWHLRRVHDRRDLLKEYKPSKPLPPFL